MKFIIQNLLRNGRIEVLAKFETEEEAQTWKSYCESLLLIDPSKGEITIIDAVEGKNVGDFL